MYFESNTRQKINLNGIWQVKFSGDTKFNNIAVPVCYVFEGDVMYKKDFKIHDSLVNNYNFVLVAEGINDDSQIKINGVFIYRNHGGFQSIIAPVDENIIRQSNTIEVNITYQKNLKNSFPFEKQFFYARNFSGIDKDIYLIAVPKIYVFSNHISYNFQGNNSIKIQNSVDILSGNIENFRNTEVEFSVRTRIVSVNSGEEIGESPRVRFTADNFQAVKCTNEFFSADIKSWSVSNPELYLLITEIFAGETLIDSRYIETGFSRFYAENNRLIENGNQYQIFGINYFEYSQKYGSALDYREISEDLNLIKSNGFNCIRVPGRIPHPYIISICQKIGLLLLPEIPLNNVPSNIMSDGHYTAEALEILEKMIKRDRNSPCVLMWGVGNDFDVASDESVNYVQRARDMAVQVDSRKIFYTTRNLKNDKCGIENVFKGLNIYTNDTSYVNTILSEGKGKNVFVSYAGISIDNNNRNGIIDQYSQDYQAMYLLNLYKNTQNSYFGSVISSFSDYYSDSPLLFTVSNNPYLITTGIFDIGRNPKFASGLIKRYLNKQTFPKINEGLEKYDADEKEFIFIITGIFTFLLIIIGFSKIKFFKDNFIKSLLSFKNFNLIIREQNPIPFQHNLFAQLLISASFSVYFSSLLYFLRKSEKFNILTTVTLTDNDLIIYFSGLINNPLYSILFFIIAAHLIFFIASLVINNLMIFSRKITNYRATLSSLTWSFLPFVIFLFIGTVFFKYAGYNPKFTGYSLYFMLFIYFVCILRLLNSLRIVYELSFSRAYITGLLLVIIIHSLLISYLLYFKSLFYFYELLTGYG